MGCTIICESLFSRIHLLRPHKMDCIIICEILFPTIHLVRSHKMNCIIICEIFIFKDPSSSLSQDGLHYNLWNFVFKDPSSSLSQDGLHYNLWRYFANDWIERTGVKEETRYRKPQQQSFEGGKLGELFWNPRRIRRRWSQDSWTRFHDK